MKKITLQNIVFPHQEDDTKALYYRLCDFAGNPLAAVWQGEKRQDEEGISLKKGSILSTDTYFNLFDVAAWHKYTGLSNWKLALQLQGECVLRFYRWDDKKTLLSKQEIKAAEKTTIEMDFSWVEQDRMFFFEIEAQDDMIFYQGEYLAKILPEKINPVHLSLLICTYRREQELSTIQAMLKKSHFFNHQSNSPASKGCVGGELNLSTQTASYYGGMSVRIIDNASELPEIDEPYITLYHNPNTGGSGGFTRGLLESRRDETEYGITHIIFMDDDVKVNMETFYRLYALLSLVKPCYQEAVVGGRMFRLNKPYIQYTAAEIWNKGDVKHIGYEQDMREGKALREMNQKLGEYSGWWFACFPMSFAKTETPLPFFLHCDDVEYGLRHGGKPILLNGIQVWHDTYENRNSPLMSYYDCRNTMIVNTLYGQYQDEKELLKKWILQMIYAFRAKKYDALYPFLLALKDYLKGKDYFMSCRTKKEIKGPKLPLAKGAVVILAAIQLPCFFLKVKRAFRSYEDKA